MEKPYEKRPAGLAGWWARGQVMGWPPLSALGDRSHSVEEKEWHTFLWLSGNPVSAALEHTRGRALAMEMYFAKKSIAISQHLFIHCGRVWILSEGKEGKEITERKKQRYREIKIKIKTFKQFCSEVRNLFASKREKWMKSANETWKENKLQPLTTLPSLSS